MLAIYIFLRTNVTIYQAGVRRQTLVSRTAWSVDELGPSLPPSHYLPGRYAGSLSLGRRMTLAQGPLSPSVYSILHGLSSRVLLSVSLFSIFIIISFFLLFQSEATFIFVLFLLFFSAHISVVCADTSAKK